MGGARRRRCGSAPSARACGLPGPVAGPVPGNCASAWRATLMWSAAVFDPAFPGAAAPPAAPRCRRPVVDERPQRVEPVPALERRRGGLLVRVRGDQGRVEVDDQRPPRRAWSGACSPASPHARARAAARAVLIAFSAAGASAASAAIVRDTVGSDATRPYTPGSARSRATSARQSPPSASVNARSRTTLPGSCTAPGLRHGASAADSSRPAGDPTVSVSSTPPA